MSVPARTDSAAGPLARPLGGLTRPDVFRRSPGGLPDGPVIMWIAVLDTGGLPLGAVELPPGMTWHRYGGNLCLWSPAGVDVPVTVPGRLGSAMLVARSGDRWEPFLPVTFDSEGGEDVRPGSVVSIRPLRITVLYTQTETRERPACTCGHPHGAHQHYRPGTDCGHRDCDCTRYEEATP